MNDVVEVTGDVPPEVVILLHDAQTSGGLLLATPPAAVTALRNDLTGRGLTAAVVGKVVAGPAGQITVTEGQ
jgi:selenide,water dikinase